MGHECDCLPHSAQRYLSLDRGYELKWKFLSVTSSSVSHLEPSHFGPTRVFSGICTLGSSARAGIRRTGEKEGPSIIVFRENAQDPCQSCRTLSRYLCIDQVDSTASTRRSFIQRHEALLQWQREAQMARPHAAEALYGYS